MTMILKHIEAESTECRLFINKNGSLQNNCFIFNYLAVTWFFLFRNRKKHFENDKCVSLKNNRFYQYFMITSIFKTLGCLKIRSFCGIICKLTWTKNIWLFSKNLYSVGLASLCSTSEVMLEYMGKTGKLYGSSDNSCPCV